LLLFDFVGSLTHVRLALIAVFILFQGRQFLVGLDGGHVYLRVPLGCFDRWAQPRT